MSVLDILKLIASDSKRKFKERVLTVNSDNETLKKVFWAAYNPDLTYWIAAQPEVNRHTGTMTLDAAIDEIIANLSTRKVTGNAAINFFLNVAAALSKEDATVLYRIVNRDLRCGVAVPTVNKIWAGLIPTYELMLASSDVSRLQFPDVVVQLKYDGIRCLITHTDSGEIAMRTRNGNQITALGAMHEDLKMAIATGETWDGELVCYGKDGKPLPRKVSNGIANKAIRGTISPAEAETVRFACWDIVDITQTIPYDKRLQGLVLAVNRAQRDGVTKVFAVQTTKVERLEDVEKLFEEALAKGEEGVIAKNLKAMWEPKRSFNLCKFKAENTADLEVLEWVEGEGKYQGKLGALLCATSDGKIKVSVGSGFSDAQRTNIHPKEVVGKIVEVMYNARITKKGGGEDSLYLPRFLRFREIEKTMADSSDLIK